MSGFNYYYDDGSNRRRGKSAALRFLMAAVILAVIICGVLLLVKRNRKEDKSAAIPQANAELAPATLSPDGKKAANPTPVGETETKIRAFLTANNPVAARDLALSAIKGCTFASPEFRRLGMMLREANLVIINRAVPCPQVIRYSVKNGDSLYNISRDFNLPMEVLRHSNQLSEGNAMIRPGQVLKIYKGDWRIKVSKKNSLLCVYDGKNLFSIYDVGIGREGRTPTGEFKIEDKIKNPPWYSPDGKVVPFGEKENVLGTRWLKLKPVGETDPYQLGYGIHGTWDEGSITRPLSNGCVRMRNADVEELYDYIPRQTPVSISE